MQLESTLVPSIGDATHCAICVSESGKALGIVSNNHVAAYLRYGQYRLFLKKDFYGGGPGCDTVIRRVCNVTKKKSTKLFCVERQEEER